MVAVMEFLTDYLTLSITTTVTYTLTSIAAAEVKNFSIFPNAIPAMAITNTPGIAAVIAEVMSSLTPNATDCKRAFITFIVTISLKTLLSLSFTRFATAARHKVGCRISLTPEAPAL